MNERKEFGFTRNRCGCEVCSVWCKHTPGYLVPSDLERLTAGVPDVMTWAREHLLASPGLGFFFQGLVVHIPSLIPRYRQDGSCHWLNTDGSCQVWEDSPYGCAYLSQCQQSGAEAFKRTDAGRTARAQAFADNSLYAQIWQMLWEEGYRAEPNLFKKGLRALQAILERRTRKKLNQERKVNRKFKKVARQRKKPK